MASQQFVSMMNMQDLAKQWGSDVPFTSRENVKRANGDFRYVVEHSNYILSPNLGLSAVIKNGEVLVDALVVPLKLEEKISKFPMELVRKDDPKMYVAAVCYKDDKPIDTLLFSASMIKESFDSKKWFKFKELIKIKDFFSTKRFFKYDKKTGEVVLKIKGNVNSPTLKKYHFNNVVAKARDKSGLSQTS